MPSDEESKPKKSKQIEMIQKIAQKMVSDILLQMHEYDLEQADYTLGTLKQLRKNAEENNLPDSIVSEIDTTIQAVNTQKEIIQTQGEMTEEQKQGISVHRRIKNAKMAYKDAIDFLKDVGTNPEKRKKLADFIRKVESYENFTDNDLKGARLANRTIDDEIFEDVYGLKSLNLTLIIPQFGEVPNLGGINISTETLDYPLNKLGSLSLVFKKNVNENLTQRELGTKEHEAIHHAEELYSERFGRDDWEIDDHILVELNSHRVNARYGTPWHRVSAKLIRSYLEPALRRVMQPGDEDVFKGQMKKYTILISQATGTMKYLQEHLPESAITHILMNTKRLSDLIKWHDVSPDHLKELTGQPRANDAEESQERRELTRVSDRLTELYEQINAANMEMMQAKTPEQQTAVKVAVNAYKGEVIALKNFIKTKE